MKDQKRNKPLVQVGDYFTTEDGELVCVADFEGKVVDTDGKTHYIRDLKHLVPVEEFQMSRTKKGEKAPGFEHWGKRGMKDKDDTKAQERAKRKAERIKWIQESEEYRLKRGID